MQHIQTTPADFAAEPFDEEVEARRQTYNVQVINNLFKFAQEVSDV